ncbi:polysaccharide deacetylase family protein [Azospirillum rugosum]|uniref:Chitooligosaccharide deacetylase n=1 Tax=Azospirillum rugosum TaxID=416170 RepID=A0ABS4SFT1_9PROT|nr:polysaccharide deacetylase family protein [Azospirillum rugosum]MBP2291357.1 peptidoglycan/xylan/chitin deacetylase (PgdA/CDA1 family) [Azospirillum rugosum]MDQ0525145.1 peptidoglycan/xylan/chitin deacetylase (PgdA/CDA1 family) [Azospirillum rugosum]
MKSGKGSSVSPLFGSVSGRNPRSLPDRSPLFATLVVAAAAVLAAPATARAAESVPAVHASLPAAATVTTIRRDQPSPRAEATAPAPTSAKALQFGTYRKEVDAWIAWKDVVRRQPDMVADLVPRVALLKPGVPDDGYVLLAAPLPDLDPNFMCRRIVGGGGSCLVVDAPAGGDSSRPPSAIEDGDSNGVVTYTPDQSREMVEIERQASRLSRLAAIVPGSDAHVDVGALKANRWNLCSLTFDDGPHPSVTPRILDILRNERVRATFFPIGNVAVRHPGIIQRIVQEGHEVGNHSLTHPNMRNLSTEGQRNEVTETNRILSAAGADPVLFRPPAGRYNQDTLKVVQGERMNTALWNIDTRDWYTRDADKIMAQVEATGAIGSVVLMHTTYNATADALPKAIALLRTRGCRFVTLSEWISSLNSLATPRIAQK